MKAVLLPIALAASLSACATYPDMKTVNRVDLDRFMGDWYVVANIPTFIEKDAHNAIETYQLGEDGVIETTFRFRQGDFDGPLKTYKPKGFIKDSQTNALWGMQFIWPIKADYRIVYLDPSYQTTIIGRQARDYVWVMSRSYQLSDRRYEELKQFVKDLGYDAEKLQRVPQQWPEAREESQ